MKPDVTIAEQILNAVQQTPDCTLEQLVAELHETPWSEIFLEVDHLSRLGRLRLASRGAGNYTVRLRVP